MIRKYLSLPAGRKLMKGIAAGLALGLLAAGILSGCSKKEGPAAETDELLRASVGWPSAFNIEEIDEPPFEDEPGRTNNAFNVVDFGEQGKGGWFYRYGNSKRPQRSRRMNSFDGEKYYQSGANGLELKKTFLHTADKISPILEWRAAEDGKVNVIVTYVKSVNGDANPAYPDGVQLLVYKGDELLKLENVSISTETENLVQISIEDLEVKYHESLYFVVDPRANNAFDGGTLYAAISDVDAEPVKAAKDKNRTSNDANNIEDFGVQGKNGWTYMYGTSPEDAALASHETESSEYINCTSPNLTISSGFIHPSLNHNAILCWRPYSEGDVDLRVRYTKFEQNDGNPDFPDGVKVKVYKNDKLLYEQHVDAPDEGENKIRTRIPKLHVKKKDRLYFMVDAEGNSSYDGGAFDITVIDVNGMKDESSVSVNWPETRQNFASTQDDFGPQGGNGFIYQWGYGDDPFNAYNMQPYDKKEDRYFHNSYLEIKRDYVNPGTHDRSAIIKWRVAQNGTVAVDASYTKTPNEDANPAWPDGTRVSLYLDKTLLTQQTFAPEVGREVTKRLDVRSLKVKKGQYITMVINGLDNTAYDGGKYQFAIRSTSGLVGKNEKSVKPFYDGKRTNFASTMDDFGKQGYNGWYYQFGYYKDPFFAVNVEKNENNEKYYTSDYVEIKKDFIVPGNKGKSANVKWIVAENGKINIDLEYTKLRNEDSNPSWPDGVTVYLMKNNTVLKKQYFAPRRDAEITRSLAIDGVSVKKGDAITMIVDPGANNAYDAGKYMFVIEDANATPRVRVGDNDNNTSLNNLESTKQGTDGWWFLEGNSPSDAKVLTKKTPDGEGYNSRRTEGLEMKKDFVHTGASRDPIYQFVVGKTGKVDISGGYVKFGQEDSNPDWPDGVTVKVWHNGKVIFSKKVKVKRGDGNDNVIDFEFDDLKVKRGDKLSFQICRDSNYAWDGGRLSVDIMEAEDIDYQPGDDNNTVLSRISSVDQGTDGWYFLEGTSLGNARLLTERNGDAWLSARDSGLEMKKDFVHTGSRMNPIYQWVVKDDGEVDLTGSYVKYGHNDSNPDWPDGITLTIYQNKKEILSRKVKVKQGDGNDNVLDFGFEKIPVKAGDIFSFRIDPDNNNAYDAGRLNVTFRDSNGPAPGEDIPDDPNRTNNAVLFDDFGEQGSNGWYYGMCDWDSQNFEKLIYDKDNNRYFNDGKPELKADFVEPGQGRNAAYKWVVAQDGTIKVAGDYTKFPNNEDENADGTCVRIFLNGEEKKWMGSQTTGNFDAARSESFEEIYDVKKGDVLIFAVNPEGNDSYDGGRLAVTISDYEEEDPGRTNNAVLFDDFGEQGSNGWTYGMCDWDSKNFSKLSYDADNNRYYNNGKPELKADFVEPGQGRNAAYRWTAAQDGTITVSIDYTKFANSADGNADGTCVRFFINGEEKKWMGDQTIGNFGEDRSDSFEDTYEVKKGDVLTFAVNPEGNDSYDGGRLAVTISDKQQEDTGRTNNAVLADDFGEQGSNGWTYGMCDWDSQKFKKLTYDADNNRYYNSGKPELKADFVEPGNGWNAAYRWEAAQTGKIYVTGSYTKFQNAADPEADGTVVRFFVNGQEKKWIGNEIQGNFAEDRTMTFSEEYDVEKGDILTFAVNPENNDRYDGGRLEITISDQPGAEPAPGGDTPAEPEDDPYAEVTPDKNRTNNTVLKDDFGQHGKEGWYYGSSDWNGSDFKKLPYDKDAKRYYDNGKPELKEDFVEPGNGRSAAYKWVVAKDGTINVKGSYTKFANSNDGNADGTCLRIVLNGDAKKWIGTNGNFGNEKSESFDETFDVKAGDVLLFVVSPENNDFYDGGRLSVEISEKKAEEPSQDAYAEVTPDKNRTNNTVLKDDFGQHGKDGWYYGSSDWNGTDFKKLPYDKNEKRYYDNGKPELKGDFVEPGNGRSAAYKWVVAKDGTINVKGSYTKFANSDDKNADGTFARIYLNGTEKKWMGTNGNFGSEKSESFNETFEVKAGDVLLFVVSPESNDSYDGGRLAVTIKDVTPASEPETGDGNGDGSGDKPEGGQSGEEVTGDQKPEGEQPALPSGSDDPSGQDNGSDDNKDQNNQDNPPSEEQPSSGEQPSGGTESPADGN